MNDAALLERWVQRRDADAFNEIVTRFADQVYGTCRNILRNDADAEEVAQECFLLLVRSGDDVRASLGGWLHRVATTKSLDRIRSEARRRKYEQAVAEETPRHAEATWNDIQEHVDAAIDTLPEDLREVVVAHFIGRKRHGEIARELRLTRRAVSYRIQRGVEALRAELVRRGVCASCASLGALLLAQALPAAPLSLKASLGKLALAAGLPAGTGTGAAIAANAAGSLILMKAKVLVAAAVLCAVIGFYVVTRPEVPTVSSPVEAPAASTPTPVATLVTDNVSPSTPELASEPAIEVPEAEVVAEEHRGAVRGVVLTPQGLPAAGALVRYAWEPNTREASVGDVSTVEAVVNPPVVTADDEGHFAFDRIPRGRVTIMAEHETGIATEAIRVRATLLTHDLSLILRAGETFSGTVVARDGSPIEGARVVPFSFNDENLDGADGKVRAQTTGEDGTFSLAHLDPGLWTFLVEAEGYGSDVSPPFSSSQSNARIVLGHGVNLECAVIDQASGEPVGGVMVALKRDGEWTSAMALPSDEAGSVVFPPLGAGTFVVEVEDKKLALDGPPLNVALDPARKPEKLIVPVVEGAQIRGRIMDQPSGDGLAGITVRASHSGTSRTAISAPSTDDGTYLITGLPSGDYTVTPTDLPQTYGEDVERQREQKVALVAGRLLDQVDFSLSPGASLGGIVVDSDGNPVEGATIVVRKEGTRFSYGTWYTASDGRFQVGDYVEGDEVHVSASSRTARSETVGPIAAGGPGSDAIELVLALEYNATISGRVTDPKGSPVSCKVLARETGASQENRTFAASGDTDGLGNFVIAGASPGTLQLTMTYDMGSPQEGPTIQVKAGQHLAGLQLTYDPGERFEIAGTVVDEEENPVPGILVRARTEGASVIPFSITDATGAFHFRDLTGGRCTLEIREDSGVEPTEQSAEAGDMEVVLPVIPRRGVTGAVMDAEGNPIGNFLITVFPGEFPDQIKLQQRFSDGAGAFELMVPLRENWMLRVEADGFAPFEAAFENFRSGGELSDGVVTLEAQ